MMSPNVAIAGQWSRKRKPATQEKIAKLWIIRKKLLRYVKRRGIFVAMKITRQAIEKGGGSIELAKNLGITRQAVEQWRVVPAERVLAVENLTGISRYELRPDIYGEPPAHPKRRAYQPASRVA